MTLEQPVDVRVAIGEVRVDHVVDLKMPFLTQGSYWLSAISTPPLPEHGKKIRDMDEDEHGTQVLQSYGRLGLFNGRHHRTVIEKIKEEYLDGKGTQNLAQRCITVTETCQ